MTEPSQYFKGRTVQEQMDEVIGYVDVRSAEVATNAIASDVAQVHQDMLDADADASAAAASAAAAAGTLANAVKKTGEASQSIAGDIAVAGDLSAGGDLAVTGDAGVQGQLSVLGGCDLRAPVTVAAPVNNTDAANKKYVDDADTLKADKTYVDAQDALKISITDINSYAVGLTGNQDPIAGDKTFTGRIKADFAKGRIAAADTLNIVTNYDGMNIYYLYMSNVQSIPGVPTGIDNGGAILYHSRIYAYGDVTNNYVFYSQMLISSSGNIYTRRHVMTTNRDTQEVTWGNENWKLHSNTEVTPI